MLQATSKPRTWSLKSFVNQESIKIFQITLKIFDRIIVNYIRKYFPLNFCIFSLKFIHLLMNLRAKSPNCKFSIPKTMAKWKMEKINNTEQLVNLFTYIIKLSSGCKNYYIFDIIKLMRWKVINSQYNLFVCLKIQNICNLVARLTDKNHLRQKNSLTMPLLHKPPRQKLPTINVPWKCRVFKGINRIINYKFIKKIKRIKNERIIARQSQVQKGIRSNTPPLPTKTL